MTDRYEPSERRDGDPDDGRREEAVDRTAMRACREEDDREAFADLLERHERRVLAVIRRMGPEAATADDLFQEVFLRVWRHRRSFRPTAPFAPWLYRIVRNVVNDWRVADARRRERRPGDEPPREVSRPDEELGRRETAERVRGEIARLPERQRDALVLRFSAGLSYGEIALALDAPIGTVGWWIKEAMATLAERLKDEVTW